jgi:hypothetical protein
VGNRHDAVGAAAVGEDRMIRAYGATIRAAGRWEHEAWAGRSVHPYHELRARVRPARLRRERGSVVVVQPTAPFGQNTGGNRMRRVIGMDIHRTFAEVVFWEDGRLRWHGRST